MGHARYKNPYFCVDFKNINMPFNDNMHLKSYNRITGFHPGKGSSFESGIFKVHFVTTECLHSSFEIYTKRGIFL
jgi:hypothetical protein